MFQSLFKVVSFLSIVLLIASCHSSRQTYRISDTTRTYTHNTPKESKRYTKKSNREIKEATSEPQVTVNSKRMEIVQEAYKYLGTPYVYGGAKPSPGFDCSGFLRYVYKVNGEKLEGTSTMMAKLGKKKSKKETKEGDLVFFGTNGKVTHVAMVVENKADELYVIHSTSKGGVRVDEILSSSYWNPKYLYSKSILN